LLRRCVAEVGRVCRCVVLWCWGVGGVGGVRGGGRVGGDTPGGGEWALVVVDGGAGGWRLRARRGCGSGRVVVVWVGRGGMLTVAVVGTVEAWVRVGGAGGLIGGWRAVQGRMESGMGGGGE